jgi:mono/diheme cytochrome c family protein
MMKNNIRIVSFALAAFVLVGSLSSCYHSKTNPGYEYAPNMYHPIAYNPDQPNTQFKNGQTAQLPVAGTEPIGFHKFAYENTMDGYNKASAELVNPFAGDTVLANTQGKTLYLNFCSHCHGALGKADGAIVLAAKFPPPPSYSTGTSSRGGAMKDLTDGKIYHTITYGLNLMGPHASQITPEERWKIVLYVHQLQNVQ